MSKREREGERERESERGRERERESERGREGERESERELLTCDLRLVFNISRLRSMQCIQMIWRGCVKGGPDSL